MTETISVETPLAQIVGPHSAKALEEAFGMRCLADFIGHLPRRHVRRGELTRMTQLQPNEHVTLVAEVVRVQSRRMQRRNGTVLTATVTDGYAQLQLVWFNQDWRKEQLRLGTRGLFSGQVKFYGAGPQLTHPDYELFEDAEQVDEAASEWASRLIPIYPATAKFQSWRFAKLMAQTLPSIPKLPDPIPAQIRQDRGQLDFDTAIRALHLATATTNLAAAKHALKFTEAFELQTALARQRALVRREPTVPRPLAAGGFRDRFDAALPFALTDDQREVGELLAAELDATVPMHRLLQGEVGSGKTLVAVRAMLQVAQSGGQSVLLAPTEVLATQHLRSITGSLGPELAEELLPTLLTGSLTKTQRQRALLRILSGEAKIIVGTHALLSEGVAIPELSLLIVDEQHRFGVEQRERLRHAAAYPPHQLVLTATPIPRTVAMTVFGDLEVSALHTLPAGRAGITTHVVGLAAHPGWLNRVWERCAEEIERGRQVFVVCPAISPQQEPGSRGATAADGRQTATVTEVSKALRQAPVFAGRTVAALHGAMSGEEKDRVMRQFAAGNLDVLVATTVIEVGVDVPNASVMVVLDADRFGMSQLHQLRGRIGRGAWPGVCLLITEADPASVAYARVSAVAETLDGFALAEEDLRLRREGDVLGSRQSGSVSSLKLLRVAEDASIIADARAAAIDLVSSDPELHGAPELLAAIDRLSGASIAHLEMG